jgi:PST family polysaccharide transporter
MAGLVDQQMRTMLLVAGPVILVVLAAAPVLVPMVYTPAFAPAIPLLEWQLAGDVLRVAGSTMAFAVLASAGSPIFLRVEIANGAATLLLSWIGVRTLGLPGLGIAFLVSSVFSAVVYAVVLRRAVGRPISRDALVILIGYTSAAVVIRFVASAELGVRGVALTALVALTGVAISARIIWNEMDGWKGLRELFRRA